MSWLVSYSIRGFYRQYSEEAKLAFETYKDQILAGDDNGFGKLMSKLELALAVGSFEDEQVVK